jgi:hypothetical protein
MKIRNFALFLYLILPCALIAQPKYDQKWVIGQEYYAPAGNTQGGMILDFAQSPPEITFFENIVGFYGIAVANDTAGNLLGYSSGCNIIHREYGIVAGSETINEGVEHDSYCPHDYGYPFLQSNMFLPKPGSDYEYVLIHEWRSGTDNTLSEVWYSTISFDPAHPLGEMTAINELASDGDFDMMVSAVQHANGRDWWVVVPYWDNFLLDIHAYYVYLLDPTGMRLWSEQDFTDVFWTASHYTGQTCFSPDGRYYARADPNNGLIVFEFDRCSGILSSPRRADLYDDAPTGVAGVAFSPNSRYVYANTIKNWYQHDMQADDLYESQYLVARYDTFYHNGFIPTNFFQEALAADGKIYMSVPNTVPYLHVIHEPNKKGDFCRAEQRGLPLPVKNSVTLPNMPHFRTGPIDGSACDTLGLNAYHEEEPEEPPIEDCLGEGISVYPNPATDYIRIDNFGCGDVYIYNVLGQLVYRSEQQASKIVWDTKAIPAGIYSVVLWDKNTPVQVVQAVVVR